MQFKQVSIKKEEIPLERKLYKFYKTLGIIEDYFAFWEGVPGLSIDVLNKMFLPKIQEAKSRYEFGMHMHEMMGMLRNGHSFYYDRAFDEKREKKLGFRAFYKDDQRLWIVKESVNSDVPAGSIISNVDGKTTEMFFNEKKKYISGSSERAQRNCLFDPRYNEWLFPEGLKLKLDQGKEVNLLPNLKRSILKNHDAREVEGRVIAYHLGYIKIPNCNTGIRYEEKALSYLNQYKDCSSLILDLRDNTGGGTPIKLTHEIMGQRWRRANFKSTSKTTTWLQIRRLTEGWADSITINREDLTDLDRSVFYERRKDSYKGKVIILVNEHTISAGEDFCIPFKDNGRATIIGTPTMGANGNCYSYKLDDSMIIGVGAVCCTYPDGSKFEGVGIIPDIEVSPTAEDLKAGRDPILEKAIEIARR
jgi:carboxyl-terminal processing protease